MKKALLVSITALLLVLSISCALFFPSSSSSEVQKNITPTVYRIAVINLALTESAGGTTVNVVNATRETPTIINFAPTATDGVGLSFSSVLNSPTDPYTDGKTYDNYDLVPLYLEMEMEAAFHFPAAADEDGYVLEFTTDGDEDSYTFRQYFNPINNFWKRDILVHLEDTQIASPTETAYPSGWYWMRRGVEPGNSNFLILAEEDGVPYNTTTNLRPAHPGNTSGSVPGTEAVIDLFADNTFWGSSTDADTYDSANPIHIDSATAAVGGLGAVMDPFPFTTDDTITAVPDVTNTFNFWYFTDPTDSDFLDPTDTDVVDFGPDSGSEKHGDWGFHPFMPIFTITST